MYLAVDPGETTGYALFSAFGELTWCDQIAGVDSFVRWLENDITERPGLIICEEWRLNPTVPQGGSTQETVQVIGALRSYAVRYGICIEFQPPRILSVGYAWAGINKLPKSLHSQSHQWDAVAHGTYYLVRQKIIPTALERNLRRKRLREMGK